MLLSNYKINFLVLIIFNLLFLSGCSLFDKVEVQNNDSASDGVDSASDGVDSASDGVDSASDGVDSASDGVDSASDTNDYWENGYCPEPVDGVEQKVSDNCNGISFEGCCDNAGNAIYCNNNDLYCKPCGDDACSWYAADTDKGAYYWCTKQDYGTDPSGTFPSSCNAYGIDTDSGDTSVVVVPQCSKEPFSCSDIDPVDTAMQVFGCCWNNVAHYCKNGGELFYLDCSKIEGTVCEADLFVWPPSASCVKPEKLPPSNPFDCGGTPSTCSDISSNSYLQLYGCCEGNTRWRCDTDIQSTPIEGNCDTAECGLVYEDYKYTDTDSSTEIYQIGYMNCR